ncbi:MAG: hypothetical protein GZ085_12510 [Sulfuriferula multivorans]|uniref:Uncharacterized protein n=1 Tax=Sulfuriferula multivorans TaxID=1559896 RepID=A0A7C9TB46_9PROT|nr:hypothetical protein [Sulfuriferula multivorans]
MHDMSGEMMEMSGMMEKGDLNPDAMKKMSKQTKQMGSMMENMSSMMGKGAMTDAGQNKQMDQMRKQIDQMRKQIDQMRKQIDQMRKDMPASSGMK